MTLVIVGASGKMLNLMPLRNERLTFLKLLILAFHFILVIFIAQSSSFTTTELLTSCLTAVKNMLSRIVKRYMRDPIKTYFGLLKIQVKFLYKL